MLDPKACGAPVKCLPPEYPAVGAISLFANLRHHLVHGPAVEFVVAEDLKRHVVLDGVSLDSLEAVVAVAVDAFVDGEEGEVEPVVVALVEGFEDGG